MDRSNPRGGVVARHPLAFFVILPPFMLALVILASATAELLIDHDVFGRAPDGFPRLYETPSARNAIAGWNLALNYAAPLVIAIAIWISGRARNVAPAWLIAGAGIICIAGGIYDVEVVWTGVRGTSRLLMGWMDDTALVAARIVANASLFALAAFWLSRRAA